MTDQKDLRPSLRAEAREIASDLDASERRSILIKTWLSHDARWFQAVALEYGMEATNRINQIAAHNLGKVEAKRISRTFDWDPVKEINDYLLRQEVLIELLGPDLLDYTLTQKGENAFEITINRCFAHDNTKKAGIADEYECGIMPRVTGWLEAFGMEYKLKPSVGKCLMAEGQKCGYAIAFK